MGMQVAITEPALVEDLGEFLRCATCRVERIGLATIAVEVPGAVSDDRAEAELALFIAAWRGLHPNVDTRVERIHPRQNRSRRGRKRLTHVG
jgi:hypothetical protein